MLFQQSKVWTITPLSPPPFRDLELTPQRSLHVKVIAHCGFRILGIKFLLIFLSNRESILGVKNSCASGCRPSLKKFRPKHFYNKNKLQKINPRPFF